MIKILVAAFAYNELKYLPEMINKEQGCELLILDIYSADGSYDYLKSNQSNAL